MRFYPHSAVEVMKSDKPIDGWDAGYRNSSSGRGHPTKGGRDGLCLCVQTPIDEQSCVLARCAPNIVHTNLSHLELVVH